MTIQIDSREKPKAIKQITEQFDKAGVKWFISKLPVGDYQSLDNARLCIDRKRRLEELCNNCGTDHERFKAELLRAIDLGIRLVILIEHGPLINSIEDIKAWNNPRLKVQPGAMTGARLAQILTVIQAKYGVEIQFCAKYHTGKRIIQILSGGALSGGREPYRVEIGNKNYDSIETRKG